MYRNTEAVISFVHTVEYERAIFTGRLKVPQIYRACSFIFDSTLLNSPNE